MEKQSTFVETMKGKIIIVFALIFLSLGVMWAVNRLAFEKITSIVQQLSMPNEKLGRTRELFMNLSNLPHLQQMEIMKGKGKLSGSFARSKKEIDDNIKELRKFLLNEPLQLARIDSIKSLLHSENKLFLEYLRLRYQLEQKRVFEKQIKALSAKMDTPKVEIDSNVVTSEKKTTTTTIIPADTIHLEQKKQSWLKRIFKKPVSEVVVTPKQPKVIIEKEIISQVDTLSVAKADTSLAGLKTSLQKIETRRSQKIEQLTASEEDLLRANSAMINQLLKILREVEKQEMEQVKQKTSSTVMLADETISRTRVITILFVVAGLIFSILILSDISRSRNYRKQLEDAKAEAEYHSISKQRFLSNMSHEIRTPLQSIIGYAEQQLNDGQGRGENIKAIYNSSQHLLQIVNEVLDYSRITSGKFSFESNIFSITGVLAEVVPPIELLAGRKSLSLQSDVTNLGSIEYVKGDAFRLKQVLFNLLGNAVKFTEKGSIKLTLSAKQIRERAILSVVVEDTGVGMTAEELKHIFNQFEQAGPDGKKTDGTGLGLSIVKELVEGQQGTITVQSEPGLGSRFEVTVPYVYTDETATASNQTQTKELLVPGTVWLVDDDALILRLSSIILTRQNIPHRCFNSAEELLIEKWDPEVKVVFADIRLPGMSGTELCKLLRKKIPDDTRIIALTAQAIPEEKEAIFKSGFNKLLLKPFTESELLQVLTEKPETEVLPAALDLGMLKKMVGNQQEVIKILQQCHEDTAVDLVELSDAAESNNKEKTSLIIHRLAGRLGQIGAKKLAIQLRRREVAIRREIDLDGLKDEIDDILYELDLFLKRLSKQIEASFAAV